MNLLVILGATCSGKSKMAVEIAQKYLDLGQKVAIVNCDSRQIYENLNIGTAKIPGIWKNLKSENQLENQLDIKNEKENENENLICKESTNISQNWQKCKQKTFFWKNIPHFLIDFVPVNSDYNLVNFVQDWCNLITFWQQNNSFDLVILVGGTGLWAKAIVENYNLGIIKDEYLEKWQKNKLELQNLNLEELQQKYWVKITENEQKITKNLEQKNSQNKYEIQKKDLNLLQKSKICHNLEIKLETKTQIKLETTFKTQNKKLYENWQILAQQDQQKKLQITNNSQIKLQNIDNLKLRIQKNDSLDKKIDKQNIQKFDEKCDEKVILNEIKKLNNSDFQNPVRLINWLLRHKTQEKNWSQKLNYPQFGKTQTVAIKVCKSELNQKIKKSVQSRIKQGLLAEVQKIATNFDQKIIWNLGLEYRESLRLLEGKIDLETWENNLIIQNQQYAKRQITWLNKESLEESLTWIKNLEELEKLLVDLEF